MVYYYSSPKILYRIVLVVGAGPKEKDIIHHARLMRVFEKRVFFAKKNPSVIQEDALRDDKHLLVIIKIIILTTFFSNFFSKTS